MREMNVTGFMHNRGRLIVSSFLVKNLFWHWAEGEKYFSSKLVDIDVANNTNNWAWISGSGTDTQPFFRVFNPWRQQIKYDPDCIYIKQHIPELANVPNDHIHKWDIYFEQHKDIKYPKPIVDAMETAQSAIKKFKKYLY